jgi:hypothetical protein
VAPYRWAGFRCDRKGRLVERYELVRSSSSRNRSVTLTVTDELQRQLQSFFQDGLVAVVGLGHSASYGLPTTPELATGLRAAVPTALAPQQAEEWQAVEQALERGDHLERALDAISHQSPVVDPIIATTADLILAAERPAIDRLSRGGARFPLAELLPLIAVDGTARVITTNYDRLIELAAEVAGLFLDTGFVGAHYAVCDPSLSHAALKSATLKRGKKVKLEYRPHVVLAKPHGSLDWYAHGEVPIRSPYQLALPRLMITPGESKYHRGYEQPFDHHINLGNRELTDAATALLASSPNVIAIERLAPDGTRVHTSTGSEDFPNSGLWQLDKFIDEVLK